MAEDKKGSENNTKCDIEDPEGAGKEECHKKRAPGSGNCGNCCYLYLR